MTFLDRMTTETGAPMPRWLYLLYKPVATVAIAAGIAGLTHLSPLPVAWAVTVFYVAIGIFTWYRRRSWTWFGPGSITGDTLYHLLPSLPAPVIAATGTPLGAKWTIVGVLVLLWWQLDTAGYGPMRAP